MSSAAPLVSVIIPCYDQSQYAYEAVLSVKRAYRGPLEIIVINDGSTKPHTRSRLDDVAQRARDERCRIEILTQENRGLSGARNSGLARANGRFIQMLDCDDLLLPGKLDDQVLHFQIADSLDVSVVDCIFSNETVDSFEKHTHLLADANYDLHDFATKWERGFSIPIHCALFRRTLFTTHLFDEGVRAKEDWLFWSRLAAAGARIAFLGGPGVIYRVHDASLCRASPEIGRYWLESALEIDRFVRPTVPNFLDGAVAWYVRTYAGATAPASSAGQPTPLESLGVKPKAAAAKAWRKGARAANPRVSIVIPVYEHFEYLGRCFASVLAQRDAQFEVVVVDDGSRDPRIKPLLQRFASETEAKVVFQTKNCGVAATLNEGVTKASGEYIAFLDCDDTLEPDALRKALAVLDEDPGCDFLFTDRHDISEDDTILRVARYGGYGDERFTGDFRRDLLNGMVASHLKLVKRASIMRAGGFEEETSGVQDWVLALKIAEFGRFAYLSEPLYNYRVHPNTVTSSDRRGQFQRTNVVRRRFAERYFKQRDVRSRFVGAGEFSLPPRTVDPGEVSVRELAEQWSARSLVLDTTAGITQSDIWSLREFNSYFDKILWSAPEIYAALLGYVWSPGILQHVSI